MANHEDDLDLLLSLQDRVLETPPASPSHQSQASGHLSDNVFSNHSKGADMSVFRDAVQEYLDHKPESAQEARKSQIPKKPIHADFEKFSGLRIRNQLLSQLELSNRFSEIRFVRLSTIKNLLMGDSLSGCWATVGILADKGIPRMSYNGKNYTIWRVGCLDENTVPVFLFGDAYQKHCKEQVGSVFALFNCGIRKDVKVHGSGFSLSTHSSGQVLKLGVSVDYGVCKAKRKDGIACTVFINRRLGAYCKYHRSKVSEKYTVRRVELMGGNLKTAFKESKKLEGIYTVDPLDDITNTGKPTKPLKLYSVEGLKKALSTADKVTTNTHSQGIRFLTQIAGKSPQGFNRADNPMIKPGKRLIPSMKASTSSGARENEKRRKTENVVDPQSKTKNATCKMIELELVSSDEDIQVL